MPCPWVDVPEFGTISLLDHRRYLKGKVQYRYVINVIYEPENTSRYRIAEWMGVVQEKQIKNTYTMRYEGQQVV